MDIFRHITPVLRTGFTAVRNIAVALCAVAFSANAAEPLPLIGNASQVSISTYHPLSQGNIAGDPGAAETRNFEIGTSFVVSLDAGKEVTLNASKGLMVYFENDTQAGLPTSVSIRGHVKSSTSDVYFPIGEAFLEYDGSRTSCYSTPVFSTETYDSFRVIVNGVKSGNMISFKKFNLYTTELTPIEAQFDPTGLTLGNTITMGVNNGVALSPSKGLLVKFRNNAATGLPTKIEVTGRVKGSDVYVDLGLGDIAVNSIGVNQVCTQSLFVDEAKAKNYDSFKFEIKEHAGTSIQINSVELFVEDRYCKYVNSDLYLQPVNVVQLNNLRGLVVKFINSGENGLPVKVTVLGHRDGFAPGEYETVGDDIELTTTQQEDGKWEAISSPYFVNVPERAYDSFRLQIKDVTNGSAAKFNEVKLSVVPRTEVKNAETEEISYKEGTPEEVELPLGANETNIKSFYMPVDGGVMLTDTKGMRVKFEATAEGDLPEKVTIEGHRTGTAATSFVPLCMDIKLTPKQINASKWEAISDLQLVQSTGNRNIRYDYFKLTAEPVAGKTLAYNPEIEIDICEQTDLRINQFEVETAPTVLTLSNPVTIPSSGALMVSYKKEGTLPVSVNIGAPTEGGTGYAELGEAYLNYSATPNKNNAFSSPVFIGEQSLSSLQLTFSIVKNNDKNSLDFSKTSIFLNNSNIGVYSVTQPSSCIALYDKVTLWQGDYTDPSRTDGGTTMIATDGDNGKQIVVSVSNNVKLGPGEADNEDKDLVVYFSRITKEGAPTVIHVYGHVPEADFEEIGWAYLMFRGDGTHEFSDRIHPKASTTYDQFKLIIEGLADGDVAQFGKFNLYAIGKDENYPAGRKDPLHLVDEYSSFFKDYTYQPNRGILEARNQYGENEKFFKEKGITADTWPWKDKTAIHHNGRDFELPTFKEQPTGVEGEGTQMPHVIEHELYAMPGDVISLSPFYDLPTSVFYMEKFSHWYEYVNPSVYDTAEHHFKPKKQNYNHLMKDGTYLLDFLIDPVGIVRTGNQGYFAGENFPRFFEITKKFVEKGKDEVEREIEYHVIHNFASLQEFADKVNSGEYSNQNAILTRDIDCCGMVRIGNDDHPYTGKFDGNSFAIKNMGNELFSVLGSGAEICNLQVLKSNFISDKVTGILVDKVKNSNVYGQTITIKNVIVTGQITNPQGSKKGGIIGVVEGEKITVSLDHVVFAGKVYTNNQGTGTPNGGLIGCLNDNNASLVSCYVYANVDGLNGNAIGDKDKAAINAMINEEEYPCSFNLFNKGGFNLEFDNFNIPFGTEYVDPSDRPHRILLYNIPSYDGKFLRMFFRTNPEVSDNRDFVFNGDHNRYTFTHTDSYYCYKFEEAEENSIDNGAWDRLTDFNKYKNDIDRDKWRCVIGWEVTNIDGTSNFYETNTNSINYIPKGNYKDVIFYNIHPGTTILPIPVPPMTRRVVEKVESFGDYKRRDSERWYGTEATFYQPLNTAYAPDDDANLSLGVEEYHIAADFANDFRSEDNYNIERPYTEEKDGQTVDHKGVIHEPVLAFRHVFHIKDGKTFADENTVIKDGENMNLKYIAKNARSVSSRALKDFQIRLTTQVPVYDPSLTVPVKTNFYYKTGEKSYDRVARVGIVEMEEGEDGQLIQKTDTKFFFDGSANTQGYRNNYPDVEKGFGGTNTSYYTGNGGGKVYRTLSCKAIDAVEGEHIVCLVALNEAGEQIKIFNSDQPLYLDKYIITFLPTEKASVTTESEMNSNPIYSEHRPERLKELYGSPTVVVDFDQYTPEKLGISEEDKGNQDILSQYYISRANIPGGAKKNSDKVEPFRYVKWPMPWYKSTYSFGFAESPFYDYNQYIIANHYSQSNVQIEGAYSNNLYDRLYYDTKETTKQMGYFLYLNAASDPGTAASLMIPKICPGTTICVSAWLAEVSNCFEVGNLCFNFIAVDNNGKRQKLHSFVSGYIDNVDYGTHAERHPQGSNGIRKDDRGQWMHIYNKFIPELPANATNINHYELELENNCISSNGADYLIDDIRAYVIPPDIIAQQLAPICDKNQTTIGIKLITRFENLLASNGLEETSENEPKQNLRLNFAVLDKAKYDALDKYLKDPENNTDPRVAESDKTKGLVEFAKIDLADMDSSGKEVKLDKYYTTINISTDYGDLSAETSANYAAMKEISTGEKCMRINILPWDENLIPNKEYYIVLFAQNPQLYPVNNIPDPRPVDFELTGDCDKYCVIRLAGSGIFKIDGVAEYDGVKEVCVGQCPIVDVDLQMKDDGNRGDQYDDYITTYKHTYDWYVGSIDDLMTKKYDDKGNEVAENATKSVYDLLVLDFRQLNENTGKYGNPDAREFPPLETGKTQDKYTPLRNLKKEGNLALNLSSFGFPPIKKPENGNYIYLTAIPILKVDAQYGDLICSQPSEIIFNVNDNSPVMYDGFQNMDYHGLINVPLRVGYKQLKGNGEEDKGVSGLSGLTVAEDNELKKKFEVIITPGTKVLEIPLREITSYKGKTYMDGETEKQITAKMKFDNDNDPFVYLGPNTDPAYVDIYKHPYDKCEIKNSLLPIGRIESLHADNTNTNGGNVVRIVFSDDMKFSEGYEYDVRLNFDEVVDPSDVAIEKPCQGHLVFTIKVVPEYIKWTGLDSRNWNNDKNWSRVTANELLRSADDENHTIVETKKYYDIILGKDKEEDGWVTLAGNQFSYAPLDFTKVVVPKLGSADSKGYPLMFTADTKTVTIGYTSTPNEEGTSTVSVDKIWNYLPTAPEGVSVGKATENIQYDMAALDSLNMIACRPWYANTCEQIHFNAGAVMVHQEHFKFGTNYQKAWVDMEMDGDRWYTLSSPLQSVVAGDMYTKKWRETEGDGENVTETLRVKENTELFNNINFDRTKGYDRFAPAVYQRGWNKATANVYRFGDTDEANPSGRAAVNLNWSRVYNDVKEIYNPGTGFSIRTVTGFTDEDADKKVSFRLPKADNNYNYFTESGGTNDSYAPADLTKIVDYSKRHSLIDFGSAEGSEGYQAEITLNPEGGSYYLAGNPFMAHLDMQKFLEVNSGVIDGTYWIMDDDRQEAAKWDEQSGVLITTGDYKKNEKGEVISGGIVAPMQGFFVKRNSAQAAPVTEGEAPATLTLTFTPDMIYDISQENAPNVLRSATRSGFEPQMITVSALDESNRVASRTVINIDSDAEGAYNSGEDTELLLDMTLDNRATVYSVASGQALAINSLNEIVETEVGILAADDAKNTLLFEGVEDMEDLYLLDTATGEFTEMYDGLTVDVEGSASGRFYITRKATGLAEANLAVVVKNRTVSAVSTADGITVRVYTLSGICMGEWSTEGNSLQFGIDPGIFLVEAVSDNQRVTRKFIVK